MHIYTHTHAKIMLKWYLDVRFYLYFAHTLSITSECSIQIKIRFSTFQKDDKFENCSLKMLFEQEIDSFFPVVVKMKF